jgi:hypothetical protein
MHRAVSLCDAVPPGTCRRSNRANLGVRLCSCPFWTLQVEVGMMQAAVAQAGKSDLEMQVRWPSNHLNCPKISPSRCPCSGNVGGRASKQPGIYTATVSTFFCKQKQSSIVKVN